MTQALSIMKKYNTYIFDADGVLWRGNNVIQGVPDIINKLIDSGKRVFILTNNSTKKLTEFVKKLNDLGFTKVKPENIVSSALVTGQYLAGKKYSNPIFLIGTMALKSTLEDFGIKSFGFGPDSVTNYSNEMTLPEAELHSNVPAVVVSFDPHISYPKMFKVVNYLKNPNVEFIATNEDATFPGQNPHRIYPGSGIFSAMVKNVTGRVPKVMGKPSKFMFDYMKEKYNIDPVTTVMIGDRLDTDIAFGNLNGIDTVLTLTGVSSVADVERARTENVEALIPKVIIDSVANFN